MPTKPLPSKPVYTETPEGPPPPAVGDYHNGDGVTTFTIKGEWQENTYANPFYTQPKVEVKLLDGTTKILDCPKCARGMFQFVTQWRKI